MSNSKTFNTCDLSLEIEIWDLFREIRIIPIIDQNAPLEFELFLTEEYGKPACRSLEGAIYMR